MTCIQAEKIAKLIVELANDKKVDKVKLQKEVYHLALAVRPAYEKSIDLPLHIIDDLKALKK